MAFAFVCVAIKGEFLIDKMTTDHQTRGPRMYFGLIVCM